MRFKVEYGVGAGIFGLIGVIIGCGGSGHSGSGTNLYPQSVAQMSRLNEAFVLYANDYDYQYCTAGDWVQGLTPYDKTMSDYHSPAVTGSAFGYALNSDVAGKSGPSFASPSTTVSLFDSTDISENATDPTSTEPNPPRYGTKNTIGYLDGHVQDSQLGNPPVTQYETSEKNLKQCALGMLQYANDWDDNLPQTNAWMSDILPYTKNSTIFYSPAVATSGSNYGYAFNQALVSSNPSQLSSPSTTQMLFDSTDLSFNATNGISTLPSPPRYGITNTIAYADGHVP